MAPLTHTRVSDRNGIPRPRRIAFFSGAYNHIADGVTLTLNRLVAHLENSGTEVLVFAPTTRNPVLEHSGTLVPIPSMPLFFRPEYRVSAGIVGEARRRLKEFDPDLFHVATPDYPGLSAMRYALKHKIPVVSSYHTHFDAYLEYYHLRIIARPVWRYLKWYYRNCRHLYVPTEQIRDILVSNGIETEMLLWPRGVDTTVFRPERRSMHWRREQGFDDDDVVISFVSRLVWEKGLHVFADALKILRERGVRHRALVVGDGPVRAELAASLGQDAVMTGHLNGAELATAYASADIFCFPSETETFGNVTLEAMASGVPTVCADAPGSSSLVVDGETGYLCEGRNAVAFADALEKLVLHRGLRYRMGDAALARARTYDWDVVLARMSGYYDQVLGRSSKVVPRVPRPARTEPTAAV